jgi:hypothetical protein
MAKFTSMDHNRNQYVFDSTDGYLLFGSCWLIFDLLLDCEDGGNKLLRNVFKLPPNYTVSHLYRHRCENLKSNIVIIQFRSPFQIVNFICQGLSDFATAISSGHRKMQTCTLLEVSISLYGDSRY